MSEARERRLVTTLGEMGRGELGLILPHEHVFLDLRTWESPGHGEADAAEVIRRVDPEISRARAAGVTAIVEPTTIGVGRRADILRAVSEASGMPLVAPTGVYREPWVPPWAHAADEGGLRDVMIGELAGEIEGTGVRAGWIKVSASDEGLTETETRILRAAAEAAVAPPAPPSAATPSAAASRWSNLTSWKRAASTRDVSSGSTPSANPTSHSTARSPDGGLGSSTTA